jgi:hypothetical protein
VGGMSFQYKYKPPFNADQSHTMVTMREYIDKLKEMQVWCDEQKMDHWGYANGVFMFSFEQDYMMFLLRWA